MVEVSVRGCGQLQCAEADVVQGLIVNAEGLVRVLNKLVYREGGIVRLNDSVGHLGRRDNREGVHDAVGVFLADLGNEPRAVRGAKPGMKKCRRGKGTMLTASLRRSAFSWPGNLGEVGLNQSKQNR